MKPRARDRAGFRYHVYSAPPLPEIGDKHADAEEPDPLGTAERMVATDTPETTTADPPDWWEQPYKGGPMVKVKGFPRPLYPPDAKSQGKTPSEDGPDVVAYKRTVSRLGRWPWGKFDDSFSNGFSHGASGNVGETGLAGVQRQAKISPDSGWLGEQTFNLLRSARVPSTLPHGGEMAMDSVAADLIDQAWDIAQRPDMDIEDVKDAIYDYLNRSIAAAMKWHYSQARPMSNLGLNPETEQWADCSTQSTSAYYWAKKITGISVPDPNHSGYNGYGYTGTLISNPEVGPPYQVGDLGLYGESEQDTEHVVTCMIEGDAQSAVWCSNGSEEAPYAVELHYRNDYLAVVRPGLLP